MDVETIMRENICFQVEYILKDGSTNKEIECHMLKSWEMNNYDIGANKVLGELNSHFVFC